MAARLIETDDRDAYEVRMVVGPSAHRARRRPLRHRLLVVGATTADVVVSAGGWIVDSVFAGCDVLALTVDNTDTRALHILGARTGALWAAMASPLRGPRPHTLAIASELLEADTHVQTLIRHSLQSGLTDVWLWGELRRDPDDSDDETGRARHRPSRAARAFKTQALATFRTSETGEPSSRSAGTEDFHSADLLAMSEPRYDLLPS